MVVGFTTTYTIST